jgi:toxin ParE1/3/4
VKLSWSIRLSAAASRDYREILRWTVENFGRRQASTYARTLAAALTDLAHGPAVTGTKLREDIGPGVHILHVARRRRKGRHFVVFRTAAGDERITDVLRLLHESMDLQRHLPAANESQILDDAQR